MSAPAVRRTRSKRGSGDQLREEIVVAAKRLLAEADRADDVPIRAVAEAVGVTTPSIYLHFADKQELLAAVVADVFRELDDAMIAAAAHETTPLGRLRAFGLAYVRFALDHPEHYRLAVLEPCPKPNIEVDEVLHSSAFSHMQATVEECIAAGIFAGDPLGITFEMWAVAHGVAALMIAKPYLPFGEAEEFADRTLCAAALGQAARSLVGADPDPGTVSDWLARQRP
ncbi:MAG TPA: TetR/AcrR family transcriptional regulator [Nocardioides sp.]|uniref:TetR/AcrR family transcriptional regulator n=1 Tax=Nocardioides sp. TaxID=35761 RepID=UPI002F3E7D51